MPLEQLCLSPQCGFSSTVEGHELTQDDELAKLRLIVEVRRGRMGLTATGRVEALDVTRREVWRAAGGERWIQLSEASLV